MQQTATSQPEFSGLNKKKFNLRLAQLQSVKRMHQYVQSLMQCGARMHRLIIEYSTDDQLTDIDAPSIAPCSNGGLYHRIVGAKDCLPDYFS